MLEAIFNFILQLFFWLIGLIGSLIIYPIQAILVTLVPGIGEFISITLGFFNQYVWNYLSFIKELVLDVSCLPRGLWSVFIAFVFARWLIAPAVRSIKLIINIWKLKSGVLQNDFICFYCFILFSIDLYYKK